MKDFNFLYDSFKSDGFNGDGPKECPPPILYIVEDDLSLGKSIQKYLGQTLGFEAHYFHGPNRFLGQLDRIMARTALEKNTPFCLICGIHFFQDTMDGLSLIGHLKKQGHHFVSIVIAGSASIETAMLSTTRRVFRYLTKPFELEVLGHWAIEALVLELGYRKEQLVSSKSNVHHPPRSRERENPRFCLERPEGKDIFCGMVGRNPLMKEVFERIKKISDSHSNIIIQGGPGTGKKLAAKAIHRISSRRERTFELVHCKAIAGELLESELFGHTEGPLAGLHGGRKGRPKLSRGGILVLERIEHMPLAIQLKLAKFLQKMEERPHRKTLAKLGLQFIVTAQRDLKLAVREGSFCRELFESLNAMVLQIPTLRERKDDLPLIISYFLDRYKGGERANNLIFDQEALKILANYHWPGNVRELENLVDKLTVFEERKIVQAKDLPAKLLQYRPGPNESKENRKNEVLINLSLDGIDLKKTLNEIEDSLIFQALRLTNGNKNQASKLLNINRTTLIEKIKKKGLIQEREL